MIFDEISKLITAQLETMSAREIGRKFNRERKAIYSLRAGCCFHCDVDFVCGLNKLGYDLQLVPLGFTNVQPIPMLSIHMMSDERERELARKGAVV